MKFDQEAFAEEFKALLKKHGMDRGMAIYPEPETNVVLTTLIRTSKLTAASLCSTIAKTYGVQVEVVSSPEELQEVLQKLRSEDDPPKPH